MLDPLAKHIRLIDGFSSQNPKKRWFSFHNWFISCTHNLWCRCQLLTSCVFLSLMFRHNVKLSKNFFRSEATQLNLCCPPFHSFVERPRVRIRPPSGRRVALHRSSRVPPIFNGDTDIERVLQSKDSSSHTHLVKKVVLNKAGYLGRSAALCSPASFRSFKKRRNWL